MMSGTRLVVQKGGSPRRVAAALGLAALLAATANGGCGNSSSGGPDGSAGSGGTGTGGAGGAAASGGSGGAGGAAATVMYSCLGANEICTQMLVPASEVSTMQQDCMNHQGGTVGTGCPTAGLVGCCQAAASDPTRAESCFYNGGEASLAMGLCTTTWVTTP